MFIPFVISFWSVLDSSGPPKKNLVVFDLFSSDSTLIYWSARRIKKSALGYFDLRSGSATDGHFYLTVVLGSELRRRPRLWPFAGKKPHNLFLIESRDQNCESNEIIFVPEMSQ